MLNKKTNKKVTFLILSFIILLFVTVLVIAHNNKIKNELFILKMELEYTTQLVDILQILEHKDFFDREIIEYFNSIETKRKIAELNNCGEKILEQLERSQTKIINKSLWKISLKNTQATFELICNFSDDGIKNGMYKTFMPSRDDFPDEVTIKWITLKGTLRGSLERITEIKRDIGEATW